MRVGQLARKLGISPTELINFLTSAGIQTPEASNTKLSADNLQVAIKHFDPVGKLEAWWQEESKQEEIKEEEVAAAVNPIFAGEEVPVVSAESVEPVETISIAEKEEVVEVPSENKSEVIKAPKVEL